MWRYIARFILRAAGWKKLPWPEGVKKCICIEAPHTSMWDFVWGKLFFVAEGLPVGVMIKKEMFFFPFGPVLKWLGSIPVDRSRASHMVDDMVKYINSKDTLIFIITPEGTRRKVTRWKQGFYHIAMKSGLPVAVSFLDYKTKTAGVIKMFQPTGNYEKDIKEIKACYKDVTAKYPENFTWED